MMVAYWVILPFFFFPFFVFAFFPFIFFFEYHTFFHLQITRKIYLTLRWV